MGIIDHSLCNLCERHNENTRHLFFNCDYTQEVWSLVKREVGLSAHVEYSEREWNFILRLCKGRTESKEIYKSVVYACIYNIWRERNSRKFTNRQSSPTRLAREIIRKIRKHQNIVLNNLKDDIKSRILCNFLQLSPSWKRKERVWCKWQGPGAEEHTLNIDGAVTETDFGFGGLIRNQAGDPIVCFSGRKGAKAVLEQELRGIEIGLKVAKQLRLKKIAIGSDSALAVNIVLRDKEEPWYHRNLIRSIKMLCNNFQNVRIYHCYRETNRPTNWLTKRGRIGEKGICMFTGPFEEEFMKLVIEDAVGTLYQR